MGLGLADQPVDGLYCSRLGEGQTLGPLGGGDLLGQSFLVGLVTATSPSDLLVDS